MFSQVQYTTPQTIAIENHLPAGSYNESLLQTEKNSTSWRNKSNPCKVTRQGCLEKK